MGKCVCHSLAGRALRQVAPKRVWRYGQILHGTLGCKFMLLVVSIFFGLKGILDSLTIEALLPFYKELNYDGVAYQRTLAMALSPYAMKGFIGSVSDYFPIAGYHKKYYLICSNILGIACVISLVVIPREVAASGIIYVGLLYWGIHLNIATADVLCEGVYCKVIQAHPAVGAKLVAFVSFCHSVGHLVGKVVVGPISDAFGTAPLLYMCIPLVLQSLFPISCNFLGEEKDTGCESRKKEKRDGGVFYVAVIISGCACVALVLNLQSWKGYSIIFTVGAIVVLGGTFWHWLSRRLALCAMFFFADRILHVQIAGAVNFYYVAPPSCVPDGPHFDYTYFCTYTAILGAVGCWFGIYAFQKWFKGWSARNVFWVTSCVRILAALFDYVIVRRLNVAIGIPDKVMFLLGDAIVYHLLLTLSVMTTSLTIARSCPPKRESTVYAIVSGVANLGSTCSKMMGAVAIQLAGIQMKESAPGGCDFKGLPNLILAAQCALPITCIPLAYFMLPKEAMNSAVPPEQRRTKSMSLVPQQSVPRSASAEEADGTDLSCGALSETLAIHEAGKPEDDVAVVAGETGNRQRTGEV